MEMAKFSELRIEELMGVVSSLKSTVLAGYGPSFQHTLISTQTGRLQITNSGSQILRTTDIDHPIGKYVVSCVSEHQCLLGDNSKSLVVLISELLYRSSLITKSACDTAFDGLSHTTTSAAQLDRDISHLLSETLPSLFTLMNKFTVRFNVRNKKELSVGMSELVYGSLSSHLLEYDCSHMSKLITNWILEHLSFLSHLNSKSLLRVINMLIDYNNAVIIENSGKSVSSSQILPGILVSRGFCNCDRPTLSLAENRNLKVLVLNCQIESIDDGILDPKVELEIPDQTHEETLSKIIGYKRLRTNAFLNLARQMGINLIITSYSLSTLEKTQCSRYGITAIHSVPEPEVEYLCNVLDIQSLCSTLELTADSITQVSSCKEVNFGGQPYVHLETVSSGQSIKPASLLVGGATEGLSRQLHRLVTDCLKTVRAALASESSYHTDSATAVSHLANSMDNVSTCSSTRKYTAASDGGDSGVCLSPNEQLRSGDECHRINFSDQVPHIAEETSTDKEVMVCIAVGGAFEISLHEVITQYLSTQRAGAPGTTALSILKQSLLALPQLIHTNAYYIAKPRWLSTLDDIKLSIKAGKVRSVDGIDGTSTSTKRIHPFSSKCQLVVSALLALRQLLKIDQIV